MIRTLKNTFKQWLAGDPFTYSASAAYYAVFSMPGLLMVVMAIAAVLFDRAAIEREILNHVRSMFGSDMALSIQKIADSTQRNDRDIWAMIIGTCTLIFGATGVFLQLQHAMNAMWHVEVKKSVPVAKFIKNRATALGVVVIIGFLLLVSMVITALLSLMSEHMEIYFTSWTVAIFHILDFVVSVGIISLLFAIIFKVLPDIHLKWPYALSGGLMSALLFSAGEYALTLYFKTAEPESAFGAAGSIVLFMIWVFYTCLIFLFGAQFTRIHALQEGEKVQTAEIAKKKKT